MTEQQPTVITDVPPVQKKSVLSRLKAPAVKATAILAVVGLGAFALGRKSANDDCACDTDDGANAGSTDTV